MDTNRITALTVKYLRKDITAAELAELDAWKNESPVNAARFEERINADNLAESMAIMEEAENIKEEARAQLKMPGRVKVQRPIWARLAAAAVLGGLVLLVVLWQENKQKSIPQPQVAVSHDLLPGGNRAILTLADGRTVTLDSAQNGVVAAQGSTKVVKTADGKLVYEGAPNSESAGMNQVSTPRGGQYMLTLPDGTQAWLNAQSTIRFPTAFSGHHREVVITGEAYLKVAKDKTRPFRVLANGTTIEDLGTEFNIQAYPDEKALQTTLVEGAVRVTKGTAAVDLSPGQQVSVTNTPGTVTNVDTGPYTAWKDGMFEFSGADIETIMRAVSRWYDVDIQYEAQKDLHTFSGQVPRDSKASDMLKILSTAGYHFRIDGKTITVLP